ncbi:MAG: hypothetical protein HC799_00710 [Limnothrix sp. RL_2_0]|nr:hypothetical protein [Limnothrix sp. RL_2_0]
MNSTKTSFHRLFSQEDFAESLQVLNQLSTQSSNQSTNIQNVESVTPYCDISWDDAAADVENFLRDSSNSSSVAKVESSCLDLTD